MNVHTRSSNPGVVTVVSESGLTQEITSGPFRFLADEPVEVGGGGAGPAPYDLLLASLGACTSLTLRLYATGKGSSVERTSGRLGHERARWPGWAGCARK